MTVFDGFVLLTLVLFVVILAGCALAASFAADMDRVDAERMSQTLGEE